MIGVIAWVLYPRAFFLGYIYEGSDDLDRSEAYYLNYLQNKPYDKFASLRLASLYDRMGEPEKATKILKELSEHRATDWKIAESYLAHLEGMKDDEHYYREAQKVGERFLELKRFSKAKAADLLDRAYRYALWQQRFEDAIQILQKLIQLPEHSKEYKNDLDSLIRGLHRTDAIVTNLEERLRQNPKDLEAAKDLIDVYLITGDLAEAKRRIDAYRALNPPTLDMLRLSAAVNERMGLNPSLFVDLESMLAFPGLPDEERASIMMSLASLALKAGETEKALEYYKLLLSEHPKNKEYWMSVFYTLNETGRTEEAIAHLKLTLETFGRDPDILRSLSSIYLYERKDLSQIPLYWEALQADPREEFALDVANALTAEKKYAEAASWLKKARGLVGASLRLDEFWIETLLADRQYEAALQVIEPWLSSNNPKMLLNAARIQVLLGNRAEAEQFYERLAGLSNNDAEIWLEVGREIHFLGNAKKALPFLRRASELAPDNAQIWFWISEAEYSLGNRDPSKSAANKAVEAFGKQARLSPEDKRMELKARARIQLTPQVREEYRVALKAQPLNQELRADFLDVLLDQRQWKEAKAQLEDAERARPGSQWKPYRVRLAFGFQRWEEAARLLEEIVQKSPELWSYRRDLAEAYSKSGRYKEAIAEYERVQKATGNDLRVNVPLRELHALYDHRISNQFRMADSGADDHQEWDLGYQGFLNSRLQLKSVFTFGRYQFGPSDYNESAEKGRVLFSYRFNPKVRAEGGVGFGISPTRKTPTFFSELDLNPADWLNLNISYDHRQLRTDLSQAVSRGNLEDKASIRWQMTRIARWIFGGAYEFSRNYLSSGAKAYQHKIEPSLNYILIREPQLTVGYQYSYVKVDDRGGFLSEVGLLPKINAHYLTGNITHAWTERFLTEAGFFVGEDVARNLHLFKGDLFGARARIAWGVTPWMDLEASYDFGRETLSGIGGQSHFLNLGISGHWQ